MSMQQDRRLLYLQRMGIDVWVPRAEEPAAADSAPTALETPAASPASESAPAGPAPTPVVSEPAVSESAVAPADWDSLVAEVASCARCALREGCSQTVFGVGNRRAPLMVIGEGPGAEEDRLGEPFVGRAGKLLDNMLRAIDLAREAVFIANVVKCRPPGNRDPLPEEVAACEPYLRRQIELVQPAVVLALGRVAAQNLLHRDDPLARLRAQTQSLDSRPVVVTYHPAYLLRSPREKSKAWQDLLRVKALLAEAR